MPAVAYFRTYSYTLLRASSTRYGGGVRGCSGHDWPIRFVGFRQNNNGGLDFCMG
jgi:hypothetical protein